MLNLLNHPWMPVVRRDGTRCFIRPAQIADGYEINPIIAIDWPRPDFRIATLEFLTGLLATAFAPSDSNGWIDYWEEPPGANELDEAFAPFAHAFNLDGDGPRFMQDLEDLQSDAEPIERLLIESPGDSTVGKNTDLLVHRGRVASLGRAAAAMALYTFQSWAPAGGAGNRTGLRGGGPLVTMVVPGARPTLWQTVWANVPQRNNAPEGLDLPLVFPWLAPTRVSEGSVVVTPVTADPLQCWWGMPRRIRLDFVAHPEPHVCGLTGAADDVHVVAWRQRPKGANYAFWGDRHPLTPHYQQKAASEKLPLHPQPGGIGYRHWLGLVVASPDGLRQPAPAVSAWRGGRDQAAKVGDARLVAAGYDMDNMKARGFVESEMPLPAATDSLTRATLDDLARILVESAEQVANLVRSAVRNALFSAGATVKLDAALLNAVRERFWDETELRFFAVLDVTARAEGEVKQAERAAWLDHMRTAALRLFDEAAPLSPDAGWTAAARIAKARRYLAIALAGYGPSGTPLLSKLGLPAVESAATKKKRSAA